MLSPSCSLKKRLMPHGIERKINNVDFILDCVWRFGRLGGQHYYRQQQEHGFGQKCFDGVNRRADWRLDFDFT